MNATQRYRETGIRTASPGQLVCALFDRTIVQAERARCAPTPEDQKKWTIAAIHTLTEVEASLAEPETDPLSQKLKRTYGLIGDHLVFAFQTGGDLAYGEAIEALEVLRNEWAAVYQLPPLSRGNVDAP